MTDTYKSPAIKVIGIANCNALCTSPSDTEKFMVSNNSYSDEDFE